MKMKTWHWAVAISALTFGFAACTVTTTDDDSDAGAGGAAQGGTGGTAQGGSAQGGSAQGGTAQGGSAQGGSAQGGSAQGGSAGGSANPCEQLPDDSCSQCVATKCCDEWTACVNDPEQFCETAVACMANCEDDAQTCATKCDDGHYNVPWNDLFNCMNDNCLADCSDQGSGGAAGAGN